jgi:hypothetical protein
MPGDTPRRNARPNGQICNAGETVAKKVGRNGGGSNTTNPAKNIDGPRDPLQDHAGRNESLVSSRGTRGIVRRPGKAAASVDRSASNATFPVKSKGAAARVRPHFIGDRDCRRGNLAVGAVPARPGFRNLGVRELHLSNKFILNPIHQRRTFPQQLTIPLSLKSRRRRIPAVLRNGPPDPSNFILRLWPRAQPTVNPTPPVRHCRTLARRPAPVLRAASPRLREIARLVAVLKPSPPRLLGFSLGFCHLLLALLAGVDGANNGLAALVDVHALHGDHRSEQRPASPKRSVRTPGR